MLSNGSINKGDDSVKSSIWSYLLQKTSKEVLVRIIFVLTGLVVGGAGANGLNNFVSESAAEEASVRIKQSNEDLIKVLQQSINDAQGDRLRMYRMIGNNSQSIDTLYKEMGEVKEDLQLQIAKGTGSLERQIGELEDIQQRTLNEILKAIRGQ